MKKQILYSSVVLSTAFMITGCSENSWNDHLDGFQSGFNYTEKINISQMLTNSDYETIGDILEGIASTEEEIAAAQAISSLHYFDQSSPYPAQIAIPYLLNQTSSEYFIYSNGSTAELTFNQASSVPAELSQLTSAYTYELTNENYQQAWESQTAYISSFAPNSPASSYVPSMLGNLYPDAEEGQFAIVTYNVANENPMFGYPDAPLPTGELVTENMAAGSYYIGAPEYGYAAINVAASNNYGYIQASEVNFSDETVSGVDAASQLFIFEDAANEGEYFIKDPTSERYYYLQGTYASFNLGAQIDQENVDNYTWTVTFGEDNAAVIKNKGNGRQIFFSTNYNNFAAYESAGDSDVYPSLYLSADNSDGEVQEIPLYTPTYTAQNVAYTYNGSAWELASDVTVLNPADYTAMGVNNNNLSDAEIYIPMYLKNKYPYASEGDEIYVAYNLKENSCSAGIFAYNGSSWSLNNNGLEEVVGLFTKSNGTWSFTKYSGKALFDLYTEAEIERDRSYMLVSGDKCANPVLASATYGYLLTTSVTISAGQIVMPNDNNAFAFLSSFEVDGKTIEVPEGYFVIKDSNDRFMYLSGSYNSFNVADTPELNADGSISQGFLFSAEPQGDGVWVITNNRADIGKKTFYYSSQYSNFAAYSSQGDNDSLPMLYILQE